MIFALGCDTWTQILTKYVMAWSLDRITSLICCIPSWPPLGFVWTHEQKIRYTNAQNQSTTYDGVKLWTCCLPPSGSGACNSLPLHVGHQIQLMPKPQVGEGWENKTGHLKYDWFIIYVSEDPLEISMFVSLVYEMHPITCNIHPKTPNIYYIK